MAALRSKLKRLLNFASGLRWFFKVLDWILVGNASRKTRSRKMQELEQPIECCMEECCKISCRNVDYDGNQNVQKDFEELSIKNDSTMKIRDVLLPDYLRQQSSITQNVLFTLQAGFQRRSNHQNLLPPNAPPPSRFIRRGERLNIQT